MTAPQTATQFNAALTGQVELPPAVPVEELGKKMTVPKQPREAIPPRGRDMRLATAREIFDALENPPEPLTLNQKLKLAAMLEKLTSGCRLRKRKKDKEREKPEPLFGDE